MASAARNCRSALDVTARMGSMDGTKDPDLLTALKKYVENTCEAIKQVDNRLKREGSSLAQVLFEIPEASVGDVSWRELIGRRDVLAHQLLTIDDERGLPRGGAGLRCPFRIAVASKLRTCQNRTRCRQGV